MLLGDAQSMSGVAKFHQPKWTRKEIKYVAICVKRFESMGCSVLVVIIKIG